MLCRKGRHLPRRPRGPGEVTHWARGWTHPWGLRGLTIDPQDRKGTISLPPPAGASQPNPAGSGLRPARGPLGIGPVLVRLCQSGPPPPLLPPGAVGVAPSASPPSPWPCRDPGSSVLGRATLLLCQSEAIGATRRWRQALSRGSPEPVMGTWREPSLRAQASRAVAQPPQLCSVQSVATGREFQDLVPTRTNLPSRCLAAGPGVALWAPGNGGVSASRRAWPASGPGAAARPCRCNLLASNRSFLRGPEPGPEHRKGSSGDILDTGFEQQAWPSYRWWRTSGPVQPGMSGLGSPAGRAGVLPGPSVAWASLPLPGSAF